MAAVDASGPPTPTGSVRFTDDTVEPGTGGTPAGSSPLLDGSATMEVVPDDAGAHPVGACYSGDVAVAPSSAAATLTVERAATTIDISAFTQAAEPTAGR